MKRAGTEKVVAASHTTEDAVNSSENLLQCMVRLYGRLEAMSADKDVDKQGLYLTASDGVSELIRHTISAPYETSFSFKIDASDERV
jgi:hypothetical protein